MLSVALAHNAEEHHVNDPGCGSDECGQTRKEGHEDCADTVVGCATNPEEEGKACKTSSYRVEDEGLCKAVNNAVVDIRATTKDSWTKIREVRGGEVQYRPSILENIPYLNLAACESEHAITNLSGLDSNLKE